MAGAAFAAAEQPEQRTTLRRGDLASGLTDRLIVRYRSVPAAAAGAGSGGVASAGSSSASTAFPDLRAQTAATVAANRYGVTLSPLRAMANGAQVLQMNRALPHADVESLASALRAGDPNVDYAEPDRVLHPTLVPNDSYYTQQWALNDATGGLRAPAAWDKSTGSGVVVAVIDTGVRPHADLAANLLPGYDFISTTQVSNDGGARDTDAYDPGDAVAAGFCGSGTAASNSSWHGTHVAGIIAAVGGNSAGVAGVAYGARILPLRALGRCGGYTSDIADAIVWAAGGSVSGVPANANPARVINLSLGGRNACDTTTQNAINAARAKGAVVVVAAGNENADVSTSSPANCTGVIAVAATGKSGGKASYSNTGSGVTIAAPGGDSGAGILSTLNAGTGAPGADNYVAYMGTSMATPHVAGVAALMLATNKALTPDQVATLLKSSARAFPAACAKCGSGIVDAQAAVTAAAAAVGGATTTPTPVVTPVPTALSEVEPNDSIAAAQKLAGWPTKVSGTIASNSDLDHFRITLPAGKQVVTTLSAGSASGFGLTAYYSNGQTIVNMTGVVGRTQQLTLKNTGSVALDLVFRVSRSSGSVGAYTLQFAN